MVDAKVELLATDAASLSLGVWEVMFEVLLILESSYYQNCHVQQAQDKLGLHTRRQINRWICILRMLRNCTGEF